MVGACLLSYVEHYYTVRPSTILSVYLFTSLLFDMTRARTLWLQGLDGPNRTIASLFAAAVAIKALILVYEALEKRHLLRPEYQSYPPEAKSSIYNRSFFWWLNPLFRLGFGRVLEVEDLFVLDKPLMAMHCGRKFWKAWVSGGCLLPPLPNT